MANAYVGNPYALVFPVDCDGFLKIPYSRNAGVGTFTANTTNTNTTLSNVSAFTGLDVGMPITGTGIPDNTTIRSLDTSANTMTISNAATATATGVTISFGSHTDITETDLWSHGAGFTVEAVITPYDVNGNGQTGKGKTLEITGPSGSYANGITNRYAQKMMLFSNTSFQFYLENQTTGNVNQPAEYRLAAKVGSTTLNSPTVIKPVSTLHGYYDADGFYNGMRTSLTKIDSNASLSLEQGSVEITGNLTSLANDKATGSLTLKDGNNTIPTNELYTDGTERTVSITVDNQPTSPNTLDATSSPATGGVDFNTKTPPISTLATRDTTKKITIPSTSSTSFNFYFFSTQSNSPLATTNNGVALTDDKFSSGTGFGTFTASTTNGSDVLVASSSLPSGLSIGMSITGSGIPSNTTISGISNATNQIQMSSEATASASGVTITYGSTDYTSSDIAVISSVNTAAGFAAALHGAVNKVNTDNSSFSISSVYVLSDDEITLSSDTNNSSFNESVTIGSSFDSDISVSGLSGGVTSSTNINEYLTITIKTGSSSTVARNFKYYPSSNSYASGDTTTTANGTTVYRVEVGNNTDGTASNLRTAINTAFNTSTEASATVSNSTVTVSQKYVGSGFGSGSSVTETSAYSAGGSNSLHTIGSFTSGTQASDTTYSKFIKINNSYFSPCDSASLAGATKTITDGSSTVTSRLFRANVSVANTVSDIVSRINTDVSNNGSSIITGSNTSTGVISFELNDFTPTMTLTTNLTNTSETGISGGQNLTAFISITDAAGVERKYKPAVDENTAASDGTYVFFEASADTAATAAQLELAIESTNGHDGSLTVSRINSTLTLAVTTTGTSETMSLDNTNITSSNVTLTAFAGAPNVVTVSQSQTGLLGAGNKIYDSSGTFIDTVASVAGTQITLSNAQSSITSTIYKEQPKEAFYVNSLYKVSCVLEKGGKLKLFFNNSLVAETAISSFTFDMTNEDCFIGQDGTNVSTQFMGELYEIGMKKGVQPSASIHTLEAGYSDIIFYYRFGDE